LAPEKGPHLAIDAALGAGVPLRIGGQAQWLNRGFFEREMRPRIDRAAGRVFWEGEVTFGPKLDLLRGARATLFPIQWEEPFGLVMIESMLLGTPVIAFARGSAPEVVEEGVTGFVVRDLGEMIERIRQVGALDRARCRARARERWSADRMARDYERVYERAAAAPIRPERRRARSRPAPRKAQGGKRDARGTSGSSARRSGAVAARRRAR
ncbi:MAG: glycosyltransferase, partial [Myxococcales bacterium]|nr:glycosyltransferase [Myxococcales bacterium]